MRGGRSTGPKTAAGREKIRLARWKHGRHSAKAREEDRFIRGCLNNYNETMREITGTIQKGLQAR